MDHALRRLNRPGCPLLLPITAPPDAVAVAVAEQVREQLGVPAPPVRARAGPGVRGHSLNTTSSTDVVSPLSAAVRTVRCSPVDNGLNGATVISCLR